MGGYGSTRWAWHSKKTAVEECRVLNLAHLIRHEVLDPSHWSYARGGIAWFTSNGEKTASVDYILDMRSDAAGVLTLEYTLTRHTGEKQEVTEPIHLQVTYPYFGGVRWWFECPLIVGGVACRQRVGNLYLPPGGVYFGCRHCYNLTYTSAQEAHKWDRAGGGLGELIKQFERLEREEKHSRRRRGWG